MSPDESQSQRCHPLGTHGDGPREDDAALTASRKAAYHMATGRGRAPDARVFSITKTDDADENGDPIEKWTEVGAAWKTEKGGFAFELAVIPVAMLAGKPVRFVLTLRDNTSNAQRPNDQRGRR